MQQNRDLAEQRTQIETQALQQKDFIAHLTHDLRTPLVGANLMFDLFQKEAFGTLAPEMHDALNAMDRSNQNLLDLVNTLLEVHCYEPGTKTLTLTTCIGASAPSTAQINYPESSEQSSSLEDG
jgi:two-component system, sensor histidine kinase and response regulator